MAYDNNEKKMESVFSVRIRAGKRRTYFFDVRETRGNDFYLTITESRKRFDSDGYDRHKIFLYKEDFNKFIKGLGETIDYVKTDLMPDFDFDAFNHDTPYEGDDNQAQKPADNSTTEPEAVSAAEPVSNLAEVPAEKLVETPATEETKSEASDETDNSAVDNGSSEIAEKW